MSSAHVEKLERLITELIEEAHALKEGDVRLAKEIKGLQKQLDQAIQSSRKNDEKLKRLSKIEAACQKMEKDRDLVRKKVRGLLDKLKRVKAGVS